MAPDAIISHGNTNITIRDVVNSNKKSELRSTSDNSEFSSSTSTLVPLMAATSQITDPTSTTSEKRRLYLLNQYTQRPFYQDFTCGLLAALFETCVTYPLNKLIFRQQLHGINVRQSINQLHDEGVRFLYRGLLFPLLQKGASRSLMFGMYDGYRHFLGCRYVPGRGKDQDLSEFMSHRHTFTRCHAMAAFLAGATEASTLTPFERVQVLMQNSKYHAQFRNSSEALRHGLRSYGIREYYRGFSMILLRNGSTCVLFFAFRLPLRDLIVGEEQMAETGVYDNRHLMADFCSGAVLGAGLSTTFYPLNVIKARMQSRLGGEFQRPYDVLYKIFKERGFSVRELYRGVTLNFSRSLLTWGITNACYEFFQTYLFRKHVLIPVSS